MTEEKSARANSLKNKIDFLIDGISKKILDIIREILNALKTGSSYVLSVYRISYVPRRERHE